MQSIRHYIIGPGRINVMRHFQEGKNGENIIELIMKAKGQTSSCSETMKKSCKIMSSEK